MAVFVLLYLGPYRNPGWLSPGFAGALLLFGLAAFSTGEFIREAVRKPYIVYNVVLGNQIYPERSRPTASRQATSKAACGRRPYVARRLSPGDGRRAHRPRAARRARPGSAAASPADRVALGEVLFQYHCNDCHAVQRLLGGRSAVAGAADREMIGSLVEHLNQTHFYMPPWSGTPEEAELLADYLVQIAPAGRRRECS